MSPSAVAAWEAHAQAAEALGRLTPDQTEVLLAYCRGHTTIEIAAQRGVTRQAIERKRSNLCRAMGVATITEAAFTAAIGGMR